MSSEKPSRSFDSVLVVGGCGFLGHHIVSQLLEGYDAKVSIIDLRTELNRFPSANYYDADITSESAVRSVLAEVKPTVIIHTASPNFVSDEGKNKALYKKVNVDGTQNLIDRAGEIGCVKAFVYTSSSSVIHDSISPLINADERWPTLRAPLQREYYSETKAMAEDLVLASNRKYANMLTIAIRPAGIFGEGDTQVVPGLLKAYYGRKTKFQLGDNMNLYDFTYVGNVAYAHILATIALVNTHELPTMPLDHERVDGEAFIITNGSPVYFWDFARLVWIAAGDQTELSQVWTIGKGLGLQLVSLSEWLFWFAGGRKPALSWKAFNYSSMARYFNIDKAKTLLGYRPLVGMEEGVTRTVRYIQEQEGRKKMQTNDKKSQ
jgi:sterol-4alpha-carboxylate 3-dehydrogenase (decarboxylating)